MSYKSPENSQDSPNRLENRLASLKTYGAIGATALVGVLGIANNAEAATPKTGIGTPASHNEAVPKNLLNINQLSRGELPPSPEILDMHERSTVEIMAYVEGEDPSTAWSVCTGAKVKIGEKEYFKSAAHCFSQLTGEKSGILNWKSKIVRAMDFVKRKDLKYLIVDPKLDPELQKTDPVAEVTGISMTKGIDEALLAFKPIDNASNEAIIPIDLNKQMNLSLRQRQPKLGKKVSIYGLPLSSGHKPVAGTGTFIGGVSLQNPDDKTYRYVHVVGINTDSPATAEDDAYKAEDDGCFWGASGSSYLAEINGSVVVSGALSGRVNRSHDAKTSFVQPVYGPDGKITKTAQQVEDDWWDFYQRSLGVDLRPLDTLCIFEVQRTDKEGVNTYRDLVKGFGKYAPSTLKVSTTKNPF